MKGIKNFIMESMSPINEDFLDDYADGVGVVTDIKEISKIMKSKKGWAIVTANDFYEALKLSVDGSDRHENLISQAEKLKKYFDGVIIEISNDRIKIGALEKSKSKMKKISDSNLFNTLFDEV